MRGEKFLHGVRLRFLQRSQLLKEADHALRLNIGVVKHADAQQVGFPFRLAAELHEDAGADHLGGGLADGRAGSASQQAAQNAETGLEETRPRRLVGTVPSHNVPDLVGHDAGELVLGRCRFNQAAIDIDEPAGQGEGVNLGCIDHFKGIGDVFAAALLYERLAQSIDVFDDRGVFDEADVLFNCPGGTTPELDLVFLRQSERVLRQGRNGNREESQTERSQHVVALWRQLSKL